MTAEAAPGLALEARGLLKTFGGVPALSAVDLAIAKGEIHALLGENGSGKSTLIKILSGFHQPDAGEVYVDGAPATFGSPEGAYASGCRFVHQDLGLIDSSSVLDNLFVNAGFPSRFGTIRGRAAVARAREQLAVVGLEDLDPRTPVAELTPARKTGVAVARALLADEQAHAKVLVLDEPTATLPDDEVRHLLDIVRRVSGSGVGVLYVTHRLDEVFELCHNVTVLRDGRKVASRAVADLDRSGLVNLLVGSELDEVHAALAALDTGHGTREAPVLEVRGLVAHPLRRVDLSVWRGDVVGIAGITGSGRETVLGSLFGAVEREAGTVTIDGAAVPARPHLAMRAGLAYLPPDRKISGGLMELSARENLTLTDLKPFWRMLLLRRRPEMAEARTWFDRLTVRGGSPDKVLGTFSGGNQQKILFGKWLRREPKVFLLDEPTQGVDVGAKAELHRQLLHAAEGGAAIVVSSSDADELAALCSRVLVLRSGVVVADLAGDDVSVLTISRACLGTTGKVVAS